MNVIFLDIDGVLNCNYSTYEMTSTHSMFVQDNKIKILKEIIDRTDAKVVLSSTWRVGWKRLELGIKDNPIAIDFVELRDKLLEFGIELYDRTPKFDAIGRRRGDEIKAWLDAHPEVDGCVIIDDLPGKYIRPCSRHLLQTSDFKGLLKKHIAVAERIMKRSIKR